MEEQGPLAFALLVGEVHVVEPPGRHYAGHFGVLRLLPVEPPEVDALLLQRVMQQVHVVDGVFLVGNVEGHIFLCRRIDAHGFGHSRIRRFPGLNARSRMQIEGGLQAFGVEFGEKVVRIGEEHLVPRIATPAQALARLVHLARGLELFPADVPAHVDDKHIQRHVVLVKTAHQLVEFLIGVVPVARPPCSESKPRGQRNPPGDLDVVAQRLAIVVPVAEEIEVLPLAGRPLDDPGPGAFFALLEAEVGGVEERTG